MAGQRGEAAYHRIPPRRAADFPAEDAPGAVSRVRNGIFAEMLLEATVVPAEQWPFLLLLETSSPAAAARTSTASDTNSERCRFTANSKLARSSAS